MQAALQLLPQQRMALLCAIGEPRQEAEPYRVKGLTVQDKSRRVCQSNSFAVPFADNSTLRKRSACTKSRTLPGERRRGYRQLPVGLFKQLVQSSLPEAVLQVTQEPPT